MKQSRHVCVVCKSKKIASKMLKHRSHWSCRACLGYSDQVIPGETPAEAAEMILVDQVNMQREMPAKKLRALNLYCGIGGNRKKWPKNISVTAVEFNPKVAAEYKKQFPDDVVIIGDAHEYLRNNYFNFDFIWTSPPCQTHSRMNYIYRPEKKRYVDMSMYQQIIFLRSFFKGAFVVENVNAYYDPLIQPDYKIGRHSFWSNFKISNIDAPHLPGFIDLNTTVDKKVMMDWLGIYLEKNIYLSGKCLFQVFRNCVHPDIGQSIFNDFVLQYSGIQL